MKEEPEINLMSKEIHLLSVYPNEISQGKNEKKQLKSVIPLKEDYGIYQSHIY